MLSMLLFSFLFLSFFGKQVGWKFGALVGCSSVILSFIISLVGFFDRMDVLYFSSGEQLRQLLWFEVEGVLSIYWH